MTTPVPPQPRQPLVAKGSRGSVSFDGWTVTVRHNGMGRQSAAVPLDQLAGVELRPASALSAGMFTLLTAGTLAPQRPVLANKNPLSLWFWPGQTKQFEHLRDVLLQAIHAWHAAANPALYAAPATGPSLSGELTQLADLLRRGVLTPEQFEQAKARLLGGQM